MSLCGVWHTLLIGSQHAVHANVILLHLHVSLSTSSSSSRLLSVNPALPSSLFLPRLQDEFELVGIILGLACYNNVIVDAHLPLPAYKKLMGLVSWQGGRG